MIIKKWQHLFLWLLPCHTYSSEDCSIKYKTWHGCYYILEIKEKQP
jgi:hypothetical protein